MYDILLHIILIGKLGSFLKKDRQICSRWILKNSFIIFLEFDKYQIKQGEEIGGFLPNWIGQFYAYFQWFYKIPSREVARQIPLDFLIAGFAGLHDLDLEVAVKKK